MADAARLDLDQNLAGSGLRHRHVLDHERLAELSDDCGFSVTMRGTFDWGQTAQSLRKARAIVTSR
jgi:hypothetical protein